MRRLLATTGSSDHLLLLFGTIILFATSMTSTGTQSNHGHLQIVLYSLVDDRLHCDPYKDQETVCSSPHLLVQLCRRDNPDKETESDVVCDTSGNRTYLLIELTSWSDRYVNHSGAVRRNISLDDLGVSELTQLQLVMTFGMPDPAGSVHGEFNAIWIWYWQEILKANNSLREWHTVDTDLWPKPGGARTPYPLTTQHEESLLSTAVREGHVKLKWRIICEQGYQPDLICQPKPTEPSTTGSRNLLLEIGISASAGLLLVVVLAGTLVFAYRRKVCCFSMRDGEPQDQLQPLTGRDSSLSTSSDES